jgi:hypothetical protein
MCRHKARRETLSTELQPNRNLHFTAPYSRRRYDDARNTTTAGVRYQSAEDRDVVVTLINDGSLDLSFDLLSENITEAEAKDLLKAADLPPIPR